LCANPVIPKNVPDNPPKDHVDNPGNEGAKEGETRDKGHKHSARTVVCGPANAEENGKTRKTGSCRGVGSEIQLDGSIGE